MPTDAEKWNQDMIDQGRIPDEDGYFHWKTQYQNMRTMRIRVYITGIPEFAMEISVPSDRDAEEYIDEFLDGILDEDMKYNCEWEVA